MGGRKAKRYKWKPNKGGEEGEMLECLFLARALHTIKSTVDFTPVSSRPIDNNYLNMQQIHFSPRFFTATLITILILI